jgi:hypothetical protein
MRDGRAKGPLCRAIVRRRGSQPRGGRMVLGCADRQTGAAGADASVRSAPSAPSSVFGPRDFAPFFRLASVRALEGDGRAGATPTPDMAGFLPGWGWRIMAETPAYGPGSGSLTDQMD